MYIYIYIYFKNFEKIFISIDHCLLPYLFIYSPKRIPLPFLFISFYNILQSRSSTPHPARISPSRNKSKAN